MLTKLVLLMFVMVASAWMYNLSWQYGLGTLVLLLSLLSIASQIRRASTMVMNSRHAHEKRKNQEKAYSVKNPFVWMFALAASAWMYNLSWEYGLGTLVLLLSLLSIASLIRKASTLEMDSMQANEHWKNQDEAHPLAAPTPEGVQQPVFGGVDSSVFERFREKHKVGGPSKTGLPGPYQAPVPPSRTAVPKMPAKAIAEPSFLIQLEDADQVRVSLSEKSRTHEVPTGNIPTSQSKQAKSESRDISHRMFSEIWPGEGKQREAGKQLSHKPTQSGAEGPLVKDKVLEDTMEDLFVDVRIPLSSEKRSGKEHGKEKQTGLAWANEEAEDHVFWQDEDISSIFQKPGPLDDTDAEAKGLLKIAIASADAGRQEEARNGLEGYLSMVNEMGNTPDPKALELSSHLKEQEITKSISNPLKPDDALTKLSPVAPESKSTGKKKEQTDYASIMDELVGALENSEAFADALPLLEDLQAYNRQQGNTVGMDALYGRIERAHLALQNEEGLIDAYEKHLEIKRQLGDRNGESRLLDELGSCYAKAGKLDRSREFLEEKLRLKTGKKEDRKREIPAVALNNQ